MLDGFERLTLLDGTEFPGDLDLMVILNSLNGEEAVSSFVEFHHCALIWIESEFATPRQQEELQLLEALSLRVRVSFRSVLDWIVIRDYFGIIFPHPTSTQTTYSNLVTLHQKEPTYSLPLGLLNRPEDPRINRFPSWMAAKLNLQNFLGTAVKLSMHDAAVKALLDAHQSLIKKQAQTLVISPRFLRIQCPYCTKFFEHQKQRGRGPIHCGSDECRKAWKADHDFTRVRSIAPGWKSAGQKRRCEHCAKRRIVNSEMLCKNCFFESLS